ncbi:hypothetical protein [Brucella pseudogrignonensis]|uniref:ABC-type uncharacterized transport system fused permease/ATPase subunit n=1 Tax=Brucella pseudogrignonensis TaxID=419475 RepID=A0ABU1M5J2_9HYPH|nr:hypothetical protein [Brucella pseudogrignonensis]MDR6431318.1 ABC-type uncharacterized transport system fused permease/ATPase subunit [Brucella pseudogrignonensis]
MNKTKQLLVAFISLFTLSLIATFVAVSGASANGVDPYVEQAFDSISPIIFDIIATAIAIALGFLLKKVTEWTGIAIEAKHRDALQSALENAARLALARGGGRQTAIRYVRSSVPDAVKFFKLTDDRITDLVEPRLSAGGEQ